MEGNRSLFQLLSRYGHSLVQMSGVAHRSLQQIELLNRMEEKDRQYNVLLTRAVLRGQLNDLYSLLVQIDERLAVLASHKEVCSLDQGRRLSDLCLEAVTERMTLEHARENTSMDQSLLANNDKQMAGDPRNCQEEG